MQDNVLWYDGLGMNDVDRVGGKNASLGEMISNLSNMGVSVPNGFATTADAFRTFMAQSGLHDKIQTELSVLDVEDVEALAVTGKKIRQWVMETPFHTELEDAIYDAYLRLKGDANDEFAVAVRSSATAEDLPDASFAGQQETFLNVRGWGNVKLALKEVFASLYNDRAISYRVHQGFEHGDVALSAGIQKMIRSDIASSGVMFTIDTESGFADIVFITGAYGLGETVVQGAVNPDEFYVHKPTLEAGKHAIVRKNIGGKAIKMIYTDGADTNTGHGKSVETVEVEMAQRQQYCISSDEIHELATQAMIIEKHYQRPMDIEWAKDGADGKLYIVQARPETVRSRDDGRVIERYVLDSTSDSTSEIVVTGRAIGQKIGKGAARLISDISEMSKVKPGDVLVTDMTDPDWEPIMKRASAIVTNRGGEPVMLLLLQEN